MDSIDLLLLFQAMWNWTDFSSFSRVVYGLCVFEEFDEYICILSGIIHAAQSLNFQYQEIYYNSVRGFYTLTRNIGLGIPAFYLFGDIRNSFDDFSRNCYQ